jgi:serine/threonine protein kinase/Flp pilus assembly protein TadD
MPGSEQERLARILDDYLVSIERGLPVSPEQLLEKYPEDAVQLRGYLSGLQLFHAAAGVSPAQAHGLISGASLPKPMQTIGDYQLVREIGRGGMGVVYEAWQMSLKRRVALKILPFTGAHDAKQIGRFKNEAQAAAQVQHPNIVPVFAVGEENGVHYYVMQLIEGQSLTSLLDGLRSIGQGRHDNTAANDLDHTLIGTSPLPSSKPVREFRPVASFAAPRNSAAVESTTANIVSMRAGETADHIQAVARLGLQAALALNAAHEFGVVHRDVKPSNLLLDDQGKLWVTDFGLARCREDSGLTQTGDVLGTMRYMSPEQALGRTALIDERTDVYSLGITMYELATLHHPADEVSDIQVYFDRQRQAPKPLRHWNRHIPPDFQTIVLKCVAELPNERYATAKELADDLQRFLDGHPIMASPPSWLSRAGKWAKRRRGVVYTSVAVLVIAFVGMLVSTMMLASANAAKEKAFIQARDRLREAHAVLDRFGTQLVDQLGAIPGAEVVRQELLEDCITLYDKFQHESIEDPSLAADLASAYSKLGSLYEKMSKTDLATDAHTKAVALWETLVNEDSSNAEAARRLALSQNDLALLMSQSGRSAEGIALLEQARDLQAKLLAAEPQSTELASDLATTHANSASLLGQTGQKAKASDELALAIKLQEPLASSHGANETIMRRLAGSYNNFAFLQDAANVKIAADAYRKAIEIQLKLVEADPINRNHRAELARTYNNLGFLSSRSKDWKNAEKCYDNAINFQKELVKSSPLAGAYRRDLAISYNNLGMAQSNDGLLDAAETSFQRSARLQDDLLTVQPNDAEMLSNQGSVWNNLGMLYDRQRRFADAETAYQKAIDNQQRAVDAAKGSTRYRGLLSQHYLNFARDLYSQNKYDAAVEIVLKRKQLCAGQAERLYSVAQQLASMYGQMRRASAPPQAQNNCLHAAIATLQEALSAGLPNARLKDPTLTNIAGNGEFQKLLEETAAAAKQPAAANQAALNH